MTIMYRKRFGLTGHPMPKNAQGKTFYDKTANYDRLHRAFQQLTDEPGLGIFSGEPGVGKTTAIRNLCSALPKPDYLVIYQCDTAVAAYDLYRNLAVEIGVRPSHRRALLWNDIKKALVHMVDERGTSPVVIIDEAHHLSDQFLLDLGGFLNFAFDSRDLLTLWLVGQPKLRRNLQMQQHLALAMRVAAQVHFEPTADRETFASIIYGCLETVGGKQKLLGDPALEMLFRASRGILRVASKLLRSALRLAHENEQAFVDERIMELAVDQMFATTPASAPTKP
jgi:type II secretory pathway predicted ATPase ExeA